MMFCQQCGSLQRLSYLLLIPCPKTQSTKSCDVAYNIDTEYKARQSPVWDLREGPRGPTHFHPPPPCSSRSGCAPKVCIQALLTMWPIRMVVYWLLNLLTPVPTVSGHDQHWPLLRFQHHHLDQNWHHLVYINVLKFCRRKRSFQWYPDQSD